MPAGAVLLSPWTDLLGTGDSLRTRARRDPWLRPAGIPLLANRYRGAAATDHPLVSPLFGDLSGFPPMLIHVGNDEILLDDSTRLASRARSAGVDVSLKIWKGMWHSFHVFYPWVPEARRAHSEIGEWVETIVENEAEPELETGYDSISRRSYRLRSAPLGSASKPRAAAAEGGGSLDRQPGQHQLNELAAGS